MIVELSTQDFARTASLFRAYEYEMSLLGAVLEGSTPSRIWVDDYAAPRTAFVCITGMFQYVAGGGPAQPAFLKAMWHIVQHDVLAAIPNPADRFLLLRGCSPDWNSLLDGFIRKKRGITWSRKLLQFNRPQFETHCRKQSGLPEGYTLCPMSGPLLESGTLHDMKLHTWSSPEAFLSKGVGMCVMRDETVVSECSTFFVGHHQAELSVYTSEDFRQQGWGTRAAAACIQRCLERGLAPTWSCWTTHTGSRALAARLGFDDVCEVPVYCWRKHLRSPLWKRGIRKLLAMKRRFGQ